MKNIYNKEWNNDKKVYWNYPFQIIYTDKIIIRITQEIFIGYKIKITNSISTTLQNIDDSNLLKCNE